MGDADGGGDVQAAADPEQTIDATDRRPESVPTSLPIGSAITTTEVVAATRDYHELLPVERHHYVITNEIAKGGMGRVLEARDLRLGRQVAIKELLPKNRDAARRFEREARITARLQHPAIIHVYEAGLWPGGEPFYAMPKVSGRSLDKVVSERATLNERLGLLPHVIAVADALAYAHNENVIHRDLKPANVLIGEFGETVVIDWGLAKDLGTVSDPKQSMQIRLRATAEETASGSIVGTPAYMPPEQARGEAVDQRADVYALGALLYKVLAGAPPYAGPSSKDVLEEVKARPPVALESREPGAPPDLAAIVAKAMARDPADRYITASSLAQDLKRFQTGQLVGAYNYTVQQRLARWLRRHRVAVAISSIAVLALIIGGVFSVRSILVEKRRAEVERSKANGGRANLLQEHGRAELLAGRAGAALAYLIGAAEDGKTGGARGFLIADAMRPFEAELAHVDVGPGDVTVAVTTDGRHVALGGAGEVSLWTSEGKQVRSFGDHGVTRVVAFDRAGTRIAAASDDGVARVWSLDGRVVAELRGHRGAILDAGFSDDGTALVTAGADATVRIWDLTTQTAVVSTSHSEPVVSAQFAGERILTASVDRTACLIDARTGALQRRLQGHTAGVTSATWTPDHDHIVTTSDDGTARVWTRWGKLVVAPLRHDIGSVVQIAAVSSDGHYVATGGSDAVVRVWELPSSLPEDGPPSTAKLVESYSGHTGRVVSVAFTDDDAQLVTGSFDGLAKIWDRDSGQAIATFAHGDVVSAVAHVPGQSRLVTASRDGSARIWNTRVAKVGHVLDSAVNALAITSDGRFAAGTSDSRVRLGRDTEIAVLQPGHLGRVFAVAFTPDGKQLVTAGEDPAPIVWDAYTGVRLRVLGSHGVPIRALVIGPDDRVVMLVDEGVELWSLATGTLISKLTTSGTRIDSIAVNPVDGAIAGVGIDGSFLVWDRTGRSLVERHDRGSPYTAVTFTPAGDALVAAGLGVVRVWRLVNGKLEVDATIEGPTGVVRAVVVTPDGSRVITGGDDGRASIWDRYKGKLLATRDRHQRPVSALAIAGDTLWIASDDGSLGAWDIRVETRSATEVKTFMDAKHVSEWLDADDVVRRRTR